MKEELKDKLHLLTQAIEQSSEGIAIVDLEGNLIYLNQAFAAMHGYTPEELLGKNLSIFHTLEQLPSVEAANRQIKKSGVFRGELWHVRRDGDVFPTMMHNSLILDDQGTPVGILGTLREISDLKREQTKLLESEEQYRKLVQDSMDGIAIVVGHEVRFVNKALVKMFGYQKVEEMVGRNVNEFISPEARNRVLGRAESRLEGLNAPSRYEFQGLRKNGTEFTAELSVSLINYHGMKSLQAVIRDITERKRAESALKESEERYRNLFESSPIGVGISDMHGNIIDFNEAMLRPGGYTREDLHHIKNIKKLYYTPDDRNRVFNAFKKNGFIDELEIQYKRKDGTPHDVLLHLRTIELDGKNCLHAWVQDITERKKAEESLRESEQKFRILAEDPIIGLFIHQDGRFIYVNDRLAEMHGYRTEELIGRPYYILVHPDERERLKARAEARHSARDKLKQHFELLRIKKTGETFWGDSIVSGIQYNGRFAFMGSVIDISERKSAEEILQQSEARFRGTFEQAAVGIAHVATDGTFLRINQRFCDIIGYSREDMLTKTFQEITHPDDLAAGLNNMQELLDNRVENHSTEKRYFHKNGSIVWVKLTVSLMRRFNGDPDYSIAIVEDITQKKRTEALLKESEEKYKSLTENSLIGVSIVKDEEYIYVNQRLAEMHGRNREEMVGRNPFDFIAPEHRKIAMQVYSERIAKGNVSDRYERKRLRKDGSEFWTEQLSTSFGNQDEQSRMTHYSDITKRKEVETWLKEAHQLLEQRVKERTLQLEEANIALKVLLERRHKDKEELGEKVLLNVRELLLPYVNKLKRGPLTESQESYLELLESGLQDIISPFTRQLTSKYMHITPGEMQVANLVKEGKTSKEIAELLNSTERAVVAHRANLRKKLGLKKKTNLRTYLLSLQ